MKMHGLEYFNITDAQRAGLVNDCNNKYKLLKTNAAAWFNKSNI